MASLFAGSTSEARLAGANVSSHELNEPASSSLLETSRRGVVRARGLAWFAAALMLGSATGAQAQAPTLVSNWTQQSPATAPPQRYATGLAYDAAHSQVVMFGGVGYSGVIGDTWLWNGTNWTPVSPATSPSARSNQTMVYDAAQGQVVMFGGATSAQGSSRLNDTWFWNGTNWSTVTPATIPPARSSAAMAYDAATGQVVMFGGLGASNSDLGDTWVWYEGNWYQENAAPSPSARFGASMAYDAALGEVILFGGFDYTGNEDNDTWAWNGDQWTQLAPASNPTARDSSGMEYDAALGQVVMFGGELAISGTYLNDTWVLSGNSPSSLTWTQQATGTSPAVRSNTNMAYDAAQGNVVMFGGYSNTAPNGSYSDTWTWGAPQNFGAINVCPAGQSTPAPCSNTLSLTYYFPTTTTIGQTLVDTQGTKDLDFAPASGGNCSGAISAGTTCTLGVTFTPQAPGLLMGSVTLFDPLGHLLVSSMIYGIGEGPQLVFGGSTFETPDNGLYSADYTLTSPLGLAVDAAGDIFIANNGGGNVVELGANGSGVSNVGFGLNFPSSVAVDGTGDVFIGQYGSYVVEVPAGCTQQSCQLYLGTFSSAQTVAVNAAGDLFVVDPSLQEVAEIPAANRSAQYVLYSPGGQFEPLGLAIDAAGDLFISDFAQGNVLEIPVGAVAPITIDSGLSSPRGITVDAAGDVYVANSGSNQVIEIPAGCASSACQIPVVTASQMGLNGPSFTPADVKLDSLGNLYVSDFGNNYVEEIPQQSLAFNAFGNPTPTPIGNASVAQSAAFENIGNQTLNSVYLNSAFTGIYNSDPLDFVQVPTTGPLPSCGVTFSLAPGAGCDLSINFEPQSVPTGGELVAALQITDNSLNTLPDANQTAQLIGYSQAATGATYPLGLSGPGAGAGSVTSADGSITCAMANGANSGGICSRVYAAGATVTLTATPNSGSSFAGWGGACASSGTNPACGVTMNAAQSVTATFVPAGNFGTVNVCAGGNPSGCTGSTQSVTFNFTATTAVSSTQVVTEGESGLDFQQGTGSACTGTFNAGQSCSVNVSFTPLAPGLRLGAAELLNGTGLVLATQLISGVGQGPEIVYGPAISGASVLSGPALEAIIGTLPYAVNPRGMATDAAGDLFIADPSNERLLMRAPNGTTTTVGTLGFPQDVAIDGAGDLFVADTGLRGVVEIPAGCTTGTCQVLAYQGASADPVAVAVDGLGDLFVADSAAGGVVEVPAGCASSSCYLPIGSNWHTVNALALDSAGDLFVTDSFAGSVSKFPAGCTSNSCRIPVGQGWIVPQGVAVDAAGDVYVSDTGAAGGMGAVFEVPAGCSSNSCEIQMVTGIFAYQLAVDELGQVYIGDGGNHQILRINQSQPPSLGFDTTNVGSISADSPQSFWALNVGNQTLSAILPGFGATGPNFYQVSGSGSPVDCTYNFSLAPGAGCNVSISFEPQVSGNLSGTASFTDNNLNGNPATQVISLIGSATALSGVPLTLSGQGSGTVVSTPPGINCTLLAGVGSGTCTANFPDDSLVSLQATPGGGFAFQAWGSGCTGSLQSLTCSFTITGGTAETASFTPGYLLTVTIDGTGTGTVSSNSGGIACSLSGGVDSGTCSGSVPTGTQVALTAIGSGNSIFAGWGGACASSGASTSCLVTVNSALNVTATYAAPGAVQPGNLKPITAGVVYAQGGSFTGVGTGVGAGGLNNPVATAVDANGNLYVADRSNNRVLYYPAGSTTATRVYGQGGSFTSNGENTGGVSANSLNQPWAVALDSSNNLYIADQFNYRVLYYPAGSTTATRVYGQNGSFTSAISNIGGISANSLSSPQGLAVDSSGNLYVSDSCRVLFFPAGTTTATRVYGQGGSFTSNTLNNGGVSANSLDNAQGIAVDSSGDLYVADIYNNRVLFYPAGSTTATRVYGQNGSFTGNTTNNGGVSANSMNQPQGLALDSGGNLYVAEYSNSRVLFFPFGSTTATRVYGQGGSFTSNAVNNGGVSANSLRQPTGVALDASGNLYVADIFNNRVVEYGPFGNVNVCPNGASTPAPCSNTYAMSYFAASTASIDSISVVTQGTAGLDFAQANGGNCSGQIISGNTCTLDVSFTPLAPGLRMGAVQLLGGGGNVLASQPIYGTGQGPAIAIAPGTQTVLPITGLNKPTKLALDAAGDLFIADYANNQVVELASGGVQSTVPTSGLNYPSGVAADGAGDLFIVDNGNVRVVEIPAGCTSSACQVTVPITGLQNPYDVAVDGAGNLYIADAGLPQVVKYLTSGVQTTVPSTTLGGPFGVAVDAVGDVFIADTYGNQVLEVTAGGVQTTVPAIGVISPEGVWVDAAGDVLIADWIGNNRIVEVPAGGGVQTLVYSGTAPEGVVTDGVGDIFIADTFASQVVEISDSFLTLNFGTVSQGYQSVDTPVTMQNVGNETLTGSMGAVLGSNFNKDQINSTCGTFSLAPGANCVQSFYALSTAVGPISANAIVNDNSLNNSSANQTITLSALSIGPAVLITATGGGTGSGVVVQNPTGINCGFVAGSSVSGPCTSNVSTGLTVSFQENPTGGSTFTGWGGACAGYGTSQFCTVFVTAATNVSASFAAASTTNYALALTEPGTGSGTVTDNQTQISCNETNGSVAGTCSGSYSSGTSVTLTANATGNSIFAGWGGACASSGAGEFCTVTMSSALSASASFVAPGLTQAGTLKPITAGVVYGQGGSFTTGIENNGGVGANSLDYLGGVAVDGSGNLYVADAGNNRVLFYPAGSTTPTRVYGQGGSFTSNTPNNGGVSANSLQNPVGVAVDSSGNLYVADDYNNRVLFFPAGSTTATRVYGQNGSFTSNAVNNGGVSANSLWEPFAVALDGGGNLYVADYVNSRVLFYPSGSTTATQVYGQGGSFTSSGANNGGISANSLDEPTGIALDSSGNLYVADLTNNRVLFYPSGSTTATQVYGQGGSFTSGAINNGGVSANSLSNPLALTLDSSGDLYVVDRSNNRVLFYPFGSTTATRVYGQLNSFTSNTANNGGVSANSLAAPYGIALDGSGNIYVSDYSNGRVLEYGTFGNANVCPNGVNTPAPCNNTIALSYYAASQTTFGATQVVTQGITGLDFSQGSGGTCIGTVSAGNTCTVNVNFTPLAPGSRMGAVDLFDNGANLLATAPIYGNGQGPAIAFGPGTQVTIPTGSFPLSNPRGMLVDAAGNLFISDVTNLQVLKIAPSGSVSTVGFGFQFPQGLAEDGAGDLFVADDYLNEVVEIPAGCASINCQVYLGSNYQSQLGVATDGAGDVFFSDFLDGEVVENPAGCTGMACQKVVYNPGGGSEPVDLTADAAGDLFFADFGLKEVVEVPAGCASSNCQITIGSGWNQPDDVAVDAAGDVFVADQGLQEIVEVPAGCTNPACQMIVVSGVNTVAVAADAMGDLVVDDLAGKRVFEVNRSQPPSYNFALTNVAATSADSPQAVTIQNVGNQELTGSVLSSLGANFAQDGSSTCGSGFSLAPGAGCSEAFDFTPQSTGYLTGSASFSDNTFNLSPLVALQTIGLTGIGGLNGQAVSTAVPNVVGLTQAAAITTLTSAGLTSGGVYTAASEIVPVGSVIASNPPAGTQVSLGSTVKVQVSNGQPVAPTPNPLTFENNYFITGDYATGGVFLRGTGVNGLATGSITIADTTTNPDASLGVPDGADILDGFLYWETLENTATASGNNGTFQGYSITGQQIGSDIPNYTDGTFTGTLRAYRADVNNYFPVNASGIRFASGAFTVSLPDGGGTAFPLTEGASLVVIYRVLSPNYPLKAVVIYDGSGLPAAPTTQTVQGFYDAAGPFANVTTLSTAPGNWIIGNSSVLLAQGASQYGVSLNANAAYSAVIFSTPVVNSDNDGILDAWKAGPQGNDFYGGSPGYYDQKTGGYVALPGAKHGEKDLFVQFDYMCGAVLANGSCDPNQENLFPAPDAQGNDPLAMVQSAFAASGVVLHLQAGNAVPESTCADSPGQLCQFPGEPGVIGWKNSLEFSKLWPRNLASCAAGGDCSPRFPYGQKDSYHYVLFGHSLAIPAWNSRYATLTSIQVVNGTTTIVTADRGAGINACPSRITISGVQGNPSLNGVYNTSSCADTLTMTLATPGVPNWSYPNNTLPEPAIGITSGTVTSISGYSDLGGADSAVTLALWETDPNQDMSKRSNVIAGTMFHEIGHTIGLSHGGLYYDTPGSYIPTFEVNCKPNYQSVMNYLFQLDLVGPSAAVAYSNQTLSTLYQASLGSVTQLIDGSNNPATFPTSAWYVPYTAGTTTASPATLHCDGTPLNNDSAYRVNGPVTTITPPWSNGQNITFDGVPYTQLRGYNDVGSIDLRQVGATGGEFASLANVLSFGSSSSPLNVTAGGTVAMGSGGTIALGSGGTVALGSGGNVTLSTGGIIALGSGGIVTLGSGGNVTLGSGGVVTAGTNGTIGLPSGGPVALSSGGIIAMGSGGIVTLGSGGIVTLGSGGIIALGSGNVTIPSTGGSYTIPNSGGTITLGNSGTVALGSGGIVTLGSGGIVTMGSGGNVTLGSGGIVALGSGGSIAMTSALGSGGIVALGSGGIVTLGSGGNVTLGSGGIVTMGSGGIVTMGSGGNVTLGGGGIVTLGSGGNLTVGSGGIVTLGSGGTVTLGSGGTVALGSGGIVTLGSGGIIAMGSGGIVTMGSGGIVTLGSGGAAINGVTEPAGNYSVSSGGIIALGSGGTVALGSGGNVTLGGAGIITMGSGGTVALGSGGIVTLGSGGVVALGSGGTVALGSGGTVALGSGGIVTLGSGGATSTELTFETANSVVRPPTAPTETPTPEGVRVDWTAPAFGVVSTYTILRSSDGATPIVIGSVSGVNGLPPATTLTDTNPDLTSQTVVYTITTSLVPDPSGSQRQSPQSAPAVLKNDQTIVLGPLPSSVSISSSTVTVTATAESSSAANGLEVSFTTAGACSIGSQSISSGVSSATLSLNSTGSCTVIASQAGSTGYNSANPVSGTFTILPQGSNTQSQTIAFPQLQNVQYGGAFSLNASSSSGLPVSFSASGPCTTAGATTGAGLCSITASAPANSTYSAASVTQSFTIFPAVIKVTAYNLTSVYGQALPALTYTYSGFVGNDTAAVVSGAPALSTTATVGSNPGSYPITVSTGSLAAANYSFLYVNGTLTVQTATATISISNLPASAVYGGSFTPTYLYSGTGSPTESTASTTTGVCTVSSGVVHFVGVGTCTLTASATATTDDSAVTGSPQSFTVGLATPTISIGNLPASAAYGGSFTPTYLYSGTGSPTESAASTTTGVCTVSSGVVHFVGVGTCTLTASATATTDDSAATGSPQSFTVGLATPTISINNLPVSAVYGGSFSPTYLYSGTGSPTESTASTTTGVCTVSSGVVHFVGVGTCTLTASATATTDDSAVTGSPQSFTVGLATPTISIGNLPVSAVYGGSFTPTYLYSGTGSPTESTASTTTGICTVSSGVVHFVGVGTCTLTASATATTDDSAVTGSPQSFMVGQATPTISIGNLPVSAVYGGSFTPAYLYSGTGSPTESTASTTTGICTVSSGVVHFVGVGTCTLTASATATTDDSAVTGSPQSFTVGLATQTITFAQPASPVTYGVSPITLSASATSGLTVTFSIDSTSTATGTISGGTLTVTGAGTLVIDANQAGNTFYKAAALVQRSIVVNKAAQTIAFTTNPPASAAYNSSFTVAAAATSSLAVTFTSSGSCSNSGATYTMTSSTGTCSVIASQAGNANYTAATAVTKTVSATGPVVAVSPSTINFGNVFLDSITIQPVTVSNTGTAAASMNQTLISILRAGSSNEFVIVNLCPTSLAAGKSCTIEVSFVAGAYYSQPQTATLNIMDSAPGSPQPVALTATVINPLASFNPTSLSFGTVKHLTSSTLNVTLGNPGATPLIFSGAGISITGTNAADFTQTNNCASSLAAGASCTIAVKFTPATTGTFSASLTVVDNAQAGGGTQTVALSGKGN